MDEAEVLAQVNTPKEVKKQDELAILFESTESFIVGAEEIKIRNFSFGELPAVIALLKGVGSHFAHYQALGTLTSVEAMMDIVSHGGENLIQALAMNTGKPREFFNKISPEDGMKIMLAFLVMNIGFFTTRVVPVLKGMK